MLQTSTQQAGTGSQGKRLGGVTGKGWMPGCSGNPKGRSGERKFDGKTLPELARDMTGEALQTVREVMLDLDAPMPVRLQAAEIVLRRGWGDAPRAPEVEHELTVIVQALRLDPAPMAGVLNHPDPRFIALSSAHTVEQA